MPLKMEKERLIANTTPQTDHDIHSPVCAYQIVESLKTLWRSKSSQLKFWTRQLARLIENKAWLLIPVDEPYGDLETMMEKEVGCTVEEFVAFMKLVGIDNDLLISLAKQNPLDHPTPGPGRGHKSDPDTAKPVSKKGNSREYLARRLARDCPEVLDEIGKGKKYKSVRQAAIATGIVKPKVTVQFDPSDSGGNIASKLYQKLSDEQWQSLVTALNDFRPN